MFFIVHSRNMKRQNSYFKSIDIFLVVPIKDSFLFSLQKLRLSGEETHAGIIYCLFFRPITTYLMLILAFYFLIHFQIFYESFITCMLFHITYLLLFFQQLFLDHLVLVNNQKMFNHHLKQLSPQSSSFYKLN